MNIHKMHWKQRETVMHFVANQLDITSVLSLNYGNSWSNNKNNLSPSSSQNREKEEKLALPSIFGICCVHLSSKAWADDTTWPSKCHFSCMYIHSDCETDWKNKKIRFSVKVASENYYMENSEFRQTEWRNSPAPNFTELQYHKLQSGNFAI